MGRILVVDDDPQVLSAFEQILGEQDYEVIVGRRGEEAIAHVEASAPDLVIMDVRMPGIGGLQAFKEIRQRDARLPVIMMTGYSTTQTAIEATKLGAFDYHLKPVDPEGLLRTVASALECVRLMRRPVEMNEGGAPAGSGEIDQPTGDVMIGQGPSMREVYKAIGRVAATDASVLIRGETGTGKELVARAIYQHSRRSGAPLVVVNCAAIPDTLLESELFGHEGGAFTGAHKQRIGRFEQAHGGTLFLDEVGDLSPAVQAKLLRALQERSFERVGGDQTIQVDVRVIAATNRELEAAVSRNEFRQDLFHRLIVFTIPVPALRDRREDIPGLADWFLRQFAEELEMAPPILTDEAREVLVGHSWPGNVRELQHCLQRAVILTGGFPLQADDIKRALAATAQPPVLELTGDERSRLRQIVVGFLRTYSGQAAHTDFLDMAEKLLLSEALALSKGNQTHAARLLGMARPTLKARLDRHGLQASRA